MGALHAGHMALVDEATRLGATTRVLSIFVNPLQFGPSEDFARYPRTFDADLERCAAHGVDVVYAPAPSTMYPEGFQTQVAVQQLTQRWEGAFRPEHFRGVTTVVAKLLIAVGPCLSVFGRKDYQQWRVIERLVRDLGLPVEVAGLRTVREADGLALSSRNRYLDDRQRTRALAIVEGLRAAQRAYAAGVRASEQLVALARAPIEQAFDKIDYVALVDGDTLEPASSPEPSDPLVLVAAHLGTTRLIDNLRLGSDPAP